MRLEWCGMGNFDRCGRGRLAGRVAVILAICLAFVAAGPFGMRSAAASDKPVLVVSGAIAGDVPRAFTRADLKRIGMTGVSTDTPWTRRTTFFEGPLLRQLLDHVGARGDRIEAVALNNYRVEVPIEDARNYDVILAMRADGQDIGIRDRGPLWLIYPWSQHEALQSELYYSRSIWQIREIIVVAGDAG
jgi:hypothetical protein